MSKFNIGDEVRVTTTNESGVVTDRMYSEAKSLFLYAIKPHDGGRSVIRKESELEAFVKQAEYKIESDIADNVVIVVIYELRNGNKIEVCRGHGHIIHEGSEGVAQALAYASKKAFCHIDSGIYHKQNRRDL
jgi:hypothetical protein